MFKIFDKDNSGSIDKDELKDLLESLGEDPSEQDLNSMLSIIDTDHSGGIGVNEFVDHMMKNVKPDEEIETIFDWFDPEKQKKINTKGILKVMNDVFKEGMTEEEAEDMVRLIVGPDRDSISEQEFKELMLQGANFNFQE